SSNGGGRRKKAESSRDPSPELSQRTAASVLAKVVTPEIVEDEMETESILAAPTEDLYGEDHDTSGDLSDEDLNVPLSSEADTAPSSDTRAIAVADPMALYLAEIRKYPVLSREEERKLAIHYYETK